MVVCISLVSISMCYIYVLTNAIFDVNTYFEVSMSELMFIKREACYGRRMMIGNTYILR